MIETVDLTGDTAAICVECGARYRTVTERCTDCGAFVTAAGTIRAALERSLPTGAAALPDDLQLRRLGGFDEEDRPRIEAALAESACPSYAAEIELAPRRAGSSRVWAIFVPDRDLERARVATRSLDDDRLVKIVTTTDQVEATAVRDALAAAGIASSESPLVAQYPLQLAGWRETRFFVRSRDRERAEPILDALELTERGYDEADDAESVSLAREFARGQYERRLFITRVLLGVSSGVLLTFGVAALLAGEPVSFVSGALGVVLLAASYRDPERAFLIAFIAGLAHMALAIALFSLPSGRSDPGAFPAVLFPGILVLAALFSGYRTARSWRLQRESPRGRGEASP